jgi:hypothetical protein
MHPVPPPVEVPHDEILGRAPPRHVPLHPSTTTTTASTPAAPHTRRPQQRGGTTPPVPAAVLGVAELEVVRVPFHRRPPATIVRPRRGLWDILQGGHQRSAPRGDRGGGVAVPERHNSSGGVDRGTSLPSPTLYLFGRIFNSVNLQGLGVVHCCCHECAEVVVGCGRKSILAVHQLLHCVPSQAGGAAAPAPLFSPTQGMLWRVSW